MVGLNSYLVLAAFVFCCGLYTSLARRNAIAVLMGIELMLNAVNINLIAFWRFGPNILDLGGQIFAICDCNCCCRSRSWFGVDHFCLSQSPNCQFG